MSIRKRVKEESTVLGEERKAKGDFKVLSHPGEWFTLVKREN